MLVKAINTLGDTTIRFVIGFYEAFIFTFISLFHIFTPHSYNLQMRKNLVTQIYHTSVRMLPYFVVMASLFGSLFIGLIIYFAAQYSLGYQIGSIIVTAVINEFSALFSAFFIIFRSKNLLSSNLSILNTRTIDNIVLSSILSGIFNTLTLSVVFTLITITSAYVFTSIFLDVDFHTYQQFIYNSVDVVDIGVLLTKSIVYGFTIMLIPLYTIKKNKQAYNNLGILFVSILFLELVFLFFQKAFNAI